MSYCAKVACCVCAHSWVAVFPDDADEDYLPCPKCGEEDSEVQTYLSPVLMGSIARGGMGEIVEYRMPKQPQHAGQIHYDPNGIPQVFFAKGPA